MGEVREAEDYVKEDLEAIGELLEIIEKCDDSIQLNHYETVLKLHLVQLRSDLSAFLKEQHLLIVPF